MGMIVSGVVFLVIAGWICTLLGGNVSYWAGLLVLTCLTLAMVSCGFVLGFIICMTLTVAYMFSPADKWDD